MEEKAKHLFDFLEENGGLDLKFKRYGIMAIERRNNQFYHGPLTTGWWDRVEGHPVETGNPEIDAWLNKKIDEGKVTELYEINYFDGYGHYKMYKFKELQEVKVWMYGIT